MRLVARLVVNALALALAAGLLEGIRVTGSGLDDRVLTVVLAGAVLAVVNAVVRPVVTLLSLPFVILTLGLLLLVINALMLLLTAVLAGELGLGFRVEGFGTAVVGAVIVTVATWLLDALLVREDRS